MSVVDAGAAPVDLEALRVRYREERDKRLRTDGVDQYIGTGGDFSYFADDPYVARVERAPVVRTCEVAIVGAGFGGILTAVKLKDAGIDDVLMIEKGGDFGGTWYWNRYPGLACDMKSYVYLPLLEETGYMPPRSYASGPEIRAHAERIVDHWSLRGRALFQTLVTRAEWIAESGRWRVSTDRGDVIEARYLVTANGPLSRPKLPGIPGIAGFAGHTFHTSRWDYAYTGGGPGGELTGLKGKRVAIIGTGATGIQCIPHLAAHAERLYVVQRTPSGVDVRREVPTDPAWVASLQPGWQQEWIDNFNALTSGAPAERDLIEDGWTFLFKKIAAAAASASGPDAILQILHAAEVADAEKMEEIRARIDAIVADPATAERLKPWYRRFCKRPVFHDGYLETFNRANVTLLDTDGRGVEAVTETGIRVGGVEYPVDCIVFASGFEVGTDYVRRAGYDIVGRDGLSLQDKWSRRFSTFHGMHVHGFPNLFLHQNAQAALPANFCHGLAEGAKAIAAVVGHARRADRPVVEATQAAEDAWVAHCGEVAANLVPFFEQCTPGYYNLEGKLTQEAAQGFGYGAGAAAFFALKDRWLADGQFDGLVFSTH
ncbi:MULTISPECIES: NAD(P)/FAD-dependent oxidoreductase [unclassified Sphingomonas]|uniref:flavin-containing monooxygenase n=1 Tax=unclassified Sphingomonas TaxID=196159 RepID=UPI0025E40C8D|nr:MULTISPECIES: NAD(P)/FAD-dependent oxidoreductase [unclassified Sphingomonas]